MTPEQILKHMKDMVKVFENLVTKEDFLNSFEKVLLKFKDLESKNTTNFSALRKSLEILSKEVKGDSTSTLEELKTSVETRLNKAISDAYAEQEKTLSFVRDSVRRLRSGKDGIDGITPVKGVDYFDGKDGSPDTSEEIREKLESLVGDERLDKSAIRGLEELEEAVKNGKHVEVKGSSRGLWLSIDGVEKGILQNINLVVGTGMSIAYSQVNGQDTITFEASGSGITIETPPETPDAIITVFTVSAEPKFVVADGTTYFNGAGYTYAALQVTMDLPPSVSIRVAV